MNRAFVTPPGPIRLVDVVANYHAIQREVDAAIQRVLDSGAFILGEEVSRFEAEFARYCGTTHCVGVASGTDALALTLRALGVGPGDDVLTVSMTFIATVLAITRCGARPVFVDIDPATYTMDVHQISRAITPKTKAIVPVHLYGQPADMDPICEVARRHGLAVVEDACQAHGAEYRGRRVGSWGDAAAFSFYPAKNLGAYGDGGAVTTSRADVAERVRLLRDYGQRTKYEHLVKGENSRLDTLQAAVLLVKLRYLDQWNARRRHLADVYRAALADTGLILPMVAEDRTHVFHLYVVQTAERDRVQHELTQQGIGAGIHYPHPVHRTLAYAEYAGLELPVTERVAQRVLSLPLYPELDEHLARDVVASTLRNVLKKR